MKKLLVGLFCTQLLVSCQNVQEESAPETKKSTSTVLTMGEGCVDMYKHSAYLLDQRNIKCGLIGREEEDNSESETADQEMAEALARETATEVAKGESHLDSTTHELELDSKTCAKMKKINVPVLIGGNAIPINTAFAYRAGVQAWKILPLGNLPNRFRRSAELIEEAMTGEGKNLDRTIAKVKKESGRNITNKQIVNILRDMNKSKSLCSNNEAYTVTRIRELIVQEIENQIIH